MDEQNADSSSSGGDLEKPSANGTHLILAEFDDPIKINPENRVESKLRK